MPLVDHCKRAGGRIDIQERTRVGPGSVASRMACTASSRDLWQVQIAYEGVRTQVVTVLGEGTWLWMTPRLTEPD